MKHENDSVMLGIDDKNLKFEIDQKENVAKRREFLKGFLNVILVSAFCCFINEVYSSEFLQQKQTYRRENMHKKSNRKLFLNEAEKIKLAETGTHDQDNQGNVLVVDWHSNGTMVLVSQIYPCLWQKGGNDTYLKKIIEELKTKGKLILVRTGLDWIAKLGKADGIEESKIKEAISWLALADLDKFDRERISRKEGVIGFIKGFIAYLDRLNDIVTENDVYRPARKEDEKNIRGGCVTDKIGWCETKKVLEEMEGRISNQKKFKKGDLHKMYYTLRVLAGLADAKELMEAINAKKVPALLITVKDYINHATHTEAQLIVARKILKDHLTKGCVLISTKLPCWSCLRIPSLGENVFKALELGINDYELQEYPAAIKLSDGSLSSKSLKGTEPIAIHLELLNPLKDRWAEYLGSGRKSETIKEKEERKKKEHFDEINRRKEQKATKKHNEELAGKYWNTDQDNY